MVQYAKDHYDLVEINPATTNWIERQKNLKASLIMQHKPELLGQRKDIPKPDFHNEESVDMNNSQILHLYFLFEIVFIQ